VRAAKDMDGRDKPGQLDILTVSMDCRVKPGNDE
jgi:hypothetical protein